MRILRFFRFSADYASGDFDRAGHCRRRPRNAPGSAAFARAGTDGAAAHFVTRRAGEAIEIMDETGLLLILLGGVVRRARFERLCEIEAALNLSRTPSSGSRRLAFS